MVASSIEADFPSQRLYDHLLTRVTCGVHKAVASGHGGDYLPSVGSKCHWNLFRSTIRDL